MAHAHVGIKVVFSVAFLTSLTRRNLVFRNEDIAAALLQLHINPISFIRVESHLVALGGVMYSTLTEINLIDCAENEWDSDSWSPRYALIAQSQAVLLSMRSSHSIADLLGGKMVSVIGFLIYTAAFALGLAFAVSMEHGDNNEDWSHYFQGGLSDAMFDWPAESSTSDIGRFWTSHTPASSFVPSQSESSDRAPALPLPMDQSKVTSDHSRAHTPADARTFETTADDMSSPEHVTTTAAPGSDSLSPPPLQMPGTEGYRSKRRGADWQRAFKTRSETLRSKWDSPLPGVFSELKYVRPLDQDGVDGTIKFHEDKDIHAHINSFFGNKINWVGLEKIPNVRLSGWRARSPIQHTSFRLPPTVTASFRGEPVEVYVTEHNLLRVSRFKNLKNSPLQDKVHLMFWGLPRVLKGANDVTFLGSGYIEKEDNEAVTEGLRSALEAAKMRL